MSKYYVVSTDVNGKEYLMHGGRVHTWDGKPYSCHGYRTRGIAEGVMKRLVKSNDEWCNGNGGEHDRCSYRVEGVEQ